MGLSTKQASSHEHVLDWNNFQTQNLEVKQPKQEIVISRRSQRQVQQFSDPLKCPRCESTNTKFCYYNNYNKSQPRHFCKTCKRHWTNGGTLRNVPVGGSRKSKRPKTPKGASVDAGTTTAVNNATINYQAADLDQDSISKSFKATNINNNLNLPNQGTMLFPFPSSSWFDQEHLFPIPTPIPSIRDAYYSNTVYSEGMDDSGFTTLMIPSSSSVGLDITSNWNWEDINTFVSSDMSTSLDGFSEIKP